MMLDMRRTFDEMVLEYSDPVRAQSILDNKFYQTVATSLAGTGNTWPWKLGQLLAQDRWDGGGRHPPSRNALDFLGAPSGSAASWTAGCGSSSWDPAADSGKLVTGAMGLAMKAVSTIVGSQMLSDAANFVQSLDTTFGGFRARADPAPTNCSSAGAPGSWWCRPPNPTRCGRRRSSSIDSRPRGCRWRA